MSDDTRIGGMSDLKELADPGGAFREVAFSALVGLASKHSGGEAFLGDTVTLADEARRFLVEFAIGLIIRDAIGITHAPLMTACHSELREEARKRFTNPPAIRIKDKRYIQRSSNATVAMPP